ncbi:glutathione degradosome [Pisolithus marmoratus]|nr:glutathione degradosome [Pisolithus marmoratus]
MNTYKRVSSGTPTAIIPPPSVSKPVPSLPSPLLVHSLGDENRSVLSLIADGRYIYAGGQCQDISVWTKQTCTLKTSLRGHTGSILALELAEAKRWLFSASGDSTVRGLSIHQIWSTAKFEQIYILYPYLETGAGDLFSLAWNPSLQIIYIGCQNTSLQWFRFSEDQIGQQLKETSSGVSTPTRRVHKFFDSYPQYTHRPADRFANNFGSLSPPLLERDASVDPASAFNIPASNVIDSAHYGYVYCMAIIPPSRTGSDDPRSPSGKCCQLLTGSGDETVKLWNCMLSGPKLLHTFECSHGAVLSLAVRSDTIFAGCQDGYVKVFDLETKTLVRTIIVQENVDILSLSMMHSDLFTCSANGQVQRWSPSFNCTSSWKAHDGIVLSSVITQSVEANGFVLVTGANDGFVKIWDMTVPLETSHNEKFIELGFGDLNGDDDHDTLTYALSTFVSIPSVSSDPLHREDCRQAAIWLKKCLHQLGAESTLLPTCEMGNPIVLGSFQGTRVEQPKPRVLFYGHYDVVSAPKDGWNSDPFTVLGRNGYLYGRGVTDDKGPIIAIACAAAELLRKRALGVDLIFLIEGEEEVGSTGFMDTVRKHKTQIGSIDAILLSNSTWITEYPPCITYGLRGVVHATIAISSGAPDQHSGVEGGAAVEPMLDMIRLLATLTDSQKKVAIPGFYESVRQQTEDEKQLYALLSQVTGRPGSVLSSRWREPSLTVHNLAVSGPGNSTVIPGTVTAQVSLRIVPDQDLECVSQSLVSHLRGSFNSFQSPNSLSVTIERTADWWLGDLDGPWFNALESAVHEEWGVQPLRIREGGSIPSIPNLEKEFGCRALHLPLGQSMDRAHLPNERMSLANLRRGKSVVERFLAKVANLEVLHA